MPKTLYDKLWEEHHITTLDSSESLLYIDRQYLHEVTSPQAFEGLSKKGLSPWRLNANIATPDHNVPTERGNSFKTENIKDEILHDIIGLKCVKNLLDYINFTYLIKIETYS